jgi:hypothetical protein
MAIEQVALHGRAQTGGAAAVIGLPSRREDKRTAERDVRLRRLLRRPLLECDYVVVGGASLEACPTGQVGLDAVGLAVN